MTEPTWTDDQMAAETASRLENLEGPDPGELVGVRSLALSSDVTARLKVNADLYRRTYSLAESWGALIDYEPGWEGRSASSTASKIVPPTCAIVHHTASNATPTRYIRDGDPGRGLAGPLALVHVTRDGVAHILGVGYSNNAGNGHRPCYDRAVDGAAPLNRDLIPGSDQAWSANRYGLSIEVNGDGGADDWTPAQRRTVVLIIAALHVVMKWDTKTKSARAIAHKELTLRKPGDPVANMGQLRAEIAAVVAEKTATKPVPPVVVPPVVVVDPVPVDPPVPPKPTETGLVVSAWNCCGYGDTAKQYTARGEWMKSTLRSSVYLLNECPPAMLKGILAALGPQFKAVSHPLGWVHVLYDSKKWEPRKHRSVTFPATKYHGALAVPLINKATRQGIDAIAIHVRPAAIATPDKKAADVRSALTLLGTWPVILGGDLALSSPPVSGLTRATSAIDTYRSSSGTQAVDSVWTRGLRVGKVLDRWSPLSDHVAWTVPVTIPSNL